MHDASAAAREAEAQRRKDEERARQQRERESALSADADKKDLERSLRDEKAQLAAGAPPPPPPPLLLLCRWLNRYRDCLSDSPPCDCVVAQLHQCCVNRYNWLACHVCV